LAWCFIKHMKYDLQIGRNESWLPSEQPGCERRTFLIRKGYWQSLQLEALSFIWRNWEETRDDSKTLVQLRAHTCALNSTMWRTGEKMRSHCKYEPVLSGVLREKLTAVQTVKTPRHSWEISGSDSSVSENSSSRVDRWRITDVSEETAFFIFRLYAANNDVSERHIKLHMQGLFGWTDPNNERKRPSSKAWQLSTNRHRANSSKA